MLLSQMIIIENTPPDATMKFRPRRYTRWIPESAGRSNARAVYNRAMEWDRPCSVLPSSRSSLS